MLRISTQRDDVVTQQRALVASAPLDNAQQAELSATQNRLEDLRIQLNATIGVVLGLAFATTLAAAFLIRRWVTRPIERLARAVRSARSGKVGVIAPQGPPEIADLARDVDAMRLQMNRALYDAVRARETIDRLIEHGETYESVFLKGNHELVATKCLRDRNLFDQWLRMGGAETLISYGIMPGRRAFDAQIAKLQAAFHAALPQAHVRFLRSLQPSFACGDFFFAHAGVKPGVALSQQKEGDMLWIRDEFLSSGEDFGKIIIHGHTPTHEVEVEPNRINIDTGAFATRLLTCLVIEESSISVIDTLSR